jgi:hypothetical protein
MFKDKLQIIYVTKLKNSLTDFKVQICIENCAYTICRYKNILQAETSVRLCFVLLASY